MKAVLYASLALMTAGAPALADASFDFRLSPGPRLVGTRAETSGSGQVHASLQGRTLTLRGTYQGLLGKPTDVHLAMGSLPGVRGPVVAPLTAADGTISGQAVLNARQLSAFQKGGLYVEIDSVEAPDGDLWGWIMPPSD
jgi:CHRD domain